MQKEGILKTILITIVFIQLLFFIPEHILKNFNVVGYSMLLGLYTMISFLSISRDKEFQEIVKHIGIYSIVFIPFVISLYTHIQYKNIIETKAENVANYTTLRILNVFVMLLQSYMVWKYNFSPSTNTNILILFISIISSLLSGLLWRELRFFITDGFHNK